MISVLQLCLSQFGAPRNALVLQNMVTLHVDILLLSVEGDHHVVLLFSGAWHGMTGCGTYSNEPKLSGMKCRVYPVFLEGKSKRSWVPKNSIQWENESSSDLLPCLWAEAARRGHVRKCYRYTLALACSAVHACNNQPYALSFSSCTCSCSCCSSS